MATTDIALRDTWALQPTSIDEVRTTSVDLARTEFVPEGLRGAPEKVLAAILYGREIGLPAMQALSQIAVVNGRPCMFAEGMRGLINAAGHQIRIVRSDATGCTVKGRRKEDWDDPDGWQQFTFTLKEAQQAGLTSKKGPWQIYPADMLLARATTRMARGMFADVIHGLTSREEASDMAVEAAGPIEATVVQPPSLTIASPVPAVEPSAVAAPARRPAAQRRATKPVSESPAEVVDAELVDDGEPITKMQLRHLHAVLNDRELGGDGHHRVVAEIVGHPVDSCSNLTAAEADRVITALELQREQQQPPVDKGCTQEQREAIGKELRRLGWDKQAALACYKASAHRDVGATADLTISEAVAVLKSLRLLVGVEDEPGQLFPDEGVGDGE